MLIHTLWLTDDGAEIPWLISAVDEYTIEEHSGLPEFYQEEMKKNPTARELILEIPDGVVGKLFNAPVVKATVK